MIASKIFKNNEGKKFLVNFKRNDKCVCGNGKKYKYCCLNKNDSSNQEHIEFSMNENDYKNNYLPIYKSFDFTPSLLVQFSVLLPYSIPFNDGICQTMVFENKAMSFRFFEIEVDDGYKYGISSENNILKRYYSKVEMTYATNTLMEELNNEREKYINEYFDSLLSKLNIIVSSYQISKKDTDIHYLTKEMFQISVVVRIIPVENWDDQESSCEYTL